MLYVADISHMTMAECAARNLVEAAQWLHYQVRPAKNLAWPHIWIAANNGSLEFLEWGLCSLRGPLHNEMHHSRKRSLLECAMNFGQVDVLRWIFRNLTGVVVDEEHVTWVAQKYHGNATLKWVFQEANPEWLGFRSSTVLAKLAGFAVICAAMQGDIAFAEWVLGRASAVERGTRQPLADSIRQQLADINNCNNIAWRAVLSGHLAFAEWSVGPLGRFGTVAGTDAVLYAASARGSIEAAIWAVSQGAVWSRKPSPGSINMKQLIENDTSFKQVIENDAAFRRCGQIGQIGHTGHIGQMEDLIDRKAESLWTANEIMQSTRDAESLWTLNDLLQSANPRQVKLLREAATSHVVPNGQAAKSQAPDGDAANGEAPNDEAGRRRRPTMCVPQNDTFPFHPLRVAAVFGRFDFIKWAISAGHCTWAPCKFPTKKSALFHGNFALAAAARDGALDFAKWARGAGCEWTVGVVTAAIRGRHLGFARWAVEAGAPWDKMAADEFEAQAFPEFAKCNVPKAKKGKFWREQLLQLSL